ncbi:unnamed protein product [Echinostoma caproni]|uniref:Histone deacetylase 14 n=1 Tax=Echinostoma caproni TaxID=27848 RepID=A0A183BD20_9TREM|nr:unnamed protein product [Echinostoma caproni]
MLDSEHVLWPKPGTVFTRPLLKLLKSGDQLPGNAKPYKAVVLKEYDGYFKALRDEDFLREETDVPSSDAIEPMHLTKKRRKV